MRGIASGKSAAGSPGRPEADQTAIDAFDPYAGPRRGRPGDDDGAGVRRARVRDTSQIQAVVVHEVQVSR